MVIREYTGQFELRFLYGKRDLEIETHMAEEIYVCCWGWRVKILLKKEFISNATLVIWEDLSIHTFSIAWPLTFENAIKSRFCLKRNSVLIQFWLFWTMLNIHTLNIALPKIFLKCNLGQFIISLLNNTIFRFKKCPVSISWCWLR